MPWWRKYNHINQSIYSSDYYFFSESASPTVKDNIAKNAVKLVDYHYRFNATAMALQNEIIPAWAGMQSEDYAQIKLPVLILWAKNDLIVPFAAPKFMLDNISQSKMIVYPSGGHFMIQHYPKQIARDVINFVIKEEADV